MMQFVNTKNIVPKLYFVVRACLDFYISLKARGIKLECLFRYLNL